MKFDKELGGQTSVNGQSYRPVKIKAHPIIRLTFYSRILWYDCLFFSHSPNHYPSTTVLNKIDVVSLIFIKCATVNYSQTFPLWCPKDIILDVLWFAQIHLCKPKPCCHILFRENRPSAGKTYKQARLVFLWFD